MTQCAKSADSSAAPVVKPVFKNISGLLLLDKPNGITSNRALQQAKHLLQAKKAGHTGSLDPIATGLLPLCFGETTKISSFFLGADKRYETRLKLGETTDTGDREGVVTNTRTVNVDESQIARGLMQFEGAIDQIPPMYSALKRNGQPLYKLARQGIEVEREPRQVTVYGLRLLKYEAPYLDLDVRCSSGFYVRSLAHDLGEALGCGAHVAELRRTEVGDLTIENAITLAQLEAVATVEDRRGLLLPSDEGLHHLPDIRLSTDAAYYLCRGQPVKADHSQETGWVRLYSHGAGFLGLGQVMDDGRVTPKRLFVRV